MSWEFKLEPTVEQVSQIETILDLCRNIWNFALQDRKDWLNSQKSPVNACSIVQKYVPPVDEPFPSDPVRAKRLTAAKSDDPTVKTVNAQVLQQILRTLDRAFEAIEAKGYGLPRFKKLNRIRSFVFPHRPKQMLKNCISDKGIKSPHHLCDRAGMIFVENLDLRVMAKGMLGKHILDAGLEPFVNPILPWVCLKRDLYDGTVDARVTSENCPDCGAEVGKDLSVRVRHCRNYGSPNPSDITSDRVISAREQRVVKNACEREAAGAGGTQSSWYLSKPEIFGAIRGISLYTC